ncbi:hypothetical protein Tco_0620970 [Tanacetum coccineum]
MRKPLFNLTLDILKQHTLYNALTLTTDALEITCNREGSSVVPDTPNHSDSSKSSVWESSDDDKTESDNDELIMKTMMILIKQTINIPTTKPNQQREKKLVKKQFDENDSYKDYHAEKLADHEPKVKCLVQIDHAEVIDESVKANVLNEVKNKLPNTSYLTHDAHRELALAESIRIDALQSRYESAQTSRKKQSYDDQDLPKNSKGEKRKKRRKGARESSSKKALAESTNFEIFAAAARIRTRIMFAKKTKSFVKKDKITKVDLKGPAFELLKNRPPGRKTIPTRYIFNKDFEYLKHGSIERPSAHDVYSKVKIISVQRIVVEKKFRYGYLKEIVVKRADQKEYMFIEVDFPRLNQNNIEDLYLLKIQDKIHNLVGVDEYVLQMLYYSILEES